MANGRSYFFLKLSKDIQKTKPDSFIGTKWKDEREQAQAVTGESIFTMRVARNSSRDSKKLQTILTDIKVQLDTAMSNLI